MFLVKLSFVESLIVEANVSPSLSISLLVKRITTLQCPFAAVAADNPSAMHAAARIAEAWGHVPGGILTSFSL